MYHFLWFAYVPRLARSWLSVVRSLAAIATGSTLLLSASSTAQASAELFVSQRGGCHNNAVHPLSLVYNAAGNAAIIESVNALGMGASGVSRGPHQHCHLLGQCQTGNHLGSD